MPAVSRRRRHSRKPTTDRSHRGRFVERNFSALRISAASSKRGTPSRLYSRHMRRFMAHTSMGWPFPLMPSSGGRRRYSSSGPSQAAQSSRGHRS